MNVRALDTQGTALIGRVAMVAAALWLPAAIAFPVAVMAQSGSPPPVFVGTVERMELVDRVEALGTLRANESVALTTQVTEIVTELKFEDGQRVNAGDILAEMTNAEEQAQLDEATATVREAELALERARPLARRGASSQAVLNERNRDYETAKARLAAVRSRLADRVVRAPFDGVVGLRRISVGALVEPGTVVTTLDDDSVMKLDFTMPATFLSSIRVGLAIEAKASAFGEQSFDGKISAVDSRVDPVTRSVTVRAILPNPDGILKSGVLMTVEVLKNERVSLVIPEKAVVANGDKTFAFVLDETSDPPKAARREIALGTRTAGFVEVLSGLESGETIVTEGMIRLRDGLSVSVEAREDGATARSEMMRRGAGNQVAKSPTAG